MAGWAVELQGHQFDIDEWREHLTAPADPHVDIISGPSTLGPDDIIVLRSSGFAGCTDAAHLYSLAVPLLRLLNGLIGAHTGARTVEVGGLIYESPAGSLHRSTVVELRGEELRVSDKVTASVNGKAVRLAPPIPTAVQQALARVSGHAAAALEHFSRSDNWHDLYKAFEALEHVVAPPRGKKSREALVKLGFHRATINDFAQTAQMYRHHDWDHPPQTEMSLSEGRAFVSDIITRVL